MDRIRRKHESERQNDVLRHNLRNVIGGIDEVSPLHDANYFEELRKSVKEIRATHYSPAKVIKMSLGEIPPLFKENKDNTEETAGRKQQGPKRVETRPKLAKPRNVAYPTVESKARKTVYIASGEKLSKSRDKLSEGDNPEFGSSLSPSQPREVPPRSHLLVDKIEAQNERIDQLEAQLRRIEAINQRLEEKNQLAHKSLALEREQMQDQLAKAHLANLEQMVNARVGEEDYGNYERSHQKSYPKVPSHRISHANAIASNVQSSDLDRHESSSPSPDLMLPSLISAHFYKLRYEQTKRKLRASIHISEFQALAIKKLANIQPSDDSTTQLILGSSDSTTDFLGKSYLDSTTALILGPRNVYDELYPKRRTALATLRAAIWAVRFTIRILRQFSDGPATPSENDSLEILHEF